MARGRILGVTDSTKAAHGVVEPELSDLIRIVNDGPRIQGIMLNGDMADARSKLRHAIDRAVEDAAHRGPGEFTTADVTAAKNAVLKRVEKVEPDVGCAPKGISNLTWSIGWAAGVDAMRAAIRALKKEMGDV